MRTTSSQRYVPTTDETRTRDTLSHVLEVVHLRGDQIHRCVHGENFTVEVPTGVRALHIAEHGDIVIRTQGKSPDRTRPRGTRTVTPWACSYDRECDADAREKRNTLAFRYFHTRRPSQRSDCCPFCRTSSNWRATQGTPVEWLEVSRPTVGRRGGRSETWFLRDGFPDSRPSLRPDPQSVGSSGRIERRMVDRSNGSTNRAGPRGRPQRPVTQLDHRRTGDAVQPCRDRLLRSASRDWVGQTPGAYITERRLDRAAELLVQTTEPVGTIAITVGYESDAAFSRAFRRRFDASPLNWRKSQLPQSLTSGRSDYACDRDPAENCNAEVHHRALHVIGARDHNHAGRASIGENPRRVDRNSRPSTTKFPLR